MNGEQEFRDILSRIKITFGLREGTLFIFLFAVFLLKIIGLFDFWKQVNWVIVALAAWLATSYIFRFLVGKQTTASGLINLYFIYDIFVEQSILAFIVYNTGGVEGFGGIFFLFPIVYTSIVFPRGKALLVYTVAGFYYLLLVLLPYFNIIPFQYYFNSGIDLHNNQKYVIDNILFTIFTFYLVGLAANLIADLLKKRATELEIVKEELEKERATLEIKVRARTNELEEIAKELDKKVKERTKELEKEKRDLEEFNKLATGRELKMIELKKQIMELKKRKEILEK